MCRKCRNEGWAPCSLNRGRWCPLEKQFMHRINQPQRVGIATYNVSQDSEAFSPGEQLHECLNK
jgi:hypothetical protein